jgi:hypothetical protein
VTLGSTGTLSETDGVGVVDEVSLGAGLTWPAGMGCQDGQQASAPVLQEPMDVGAVRVHDVDADRYGRLITSVKMSVCPSGLPGEFRPSVHTGYRSDPPTAIPL